MEKKERLVPPSYRPIPRQERLAWVVAGLAMALPWVISGSEYQLWAYQQNQSSPAVRITPNGYAYHTLDHYSEPRWNSSVVSLFTASYEDNRSACKVCRPVLPDHEYSGQPAPMGRWVWWMAIFGIVLASCKWHENDGAGPGGGCSFHGSRR